MKESFLCLTMNPVSRCVKDIGAPDAEVFTVRAILIFIWTDILLPAR